MTQVLSCSINSLPALYFSLLSILGRSHITSIGWVFHWCDLLHTTLSWRADCFGCYCQIPHLCPTLSVSECSLTELFMMFAAIINCWKCVCIIYFLLFLFWLGNHPPETYRGTYLFSLQGCNLPKLILVSIASVSEICKNDASEYTVCMTTLLE